jgi:hypothetical protein
LKLKRSNLLLRGFCSTVPGLVEVWNRPTPWGDDGFRHRWRRQTDGLVSSGPQTRKNLLPTGCLSLTALDEFEGLAAEPIDAWIRVDPTIRQGAGIKTLEIRTHLWQG